MYEVDSGETILENRATRISKRIGGVIINELPRKRKENVMRQNRKSTMQKKSAFIKTFDTGPFKVGNLAILDYTP